MRVRALIFLLFACSWSWSCTSNHHVSPFPNADTLRLVPAADLDRQLARLDEEAHRSGFVLVVERRGRLADGSVFVMRGYRATDTLGRSVYATRVATPQSIVLALGPPDAGDPLPPATELVEHLVDGGFRSGTDLNGDGAPDVVVKDATGTLQIWRIDSLGASAYPVKLLWPPRRALDIDGDGRPDLAGSPPGFDGDPIAPDLVDVATFGESGYDDASAAVRLWHAAEERKADARAAQALADKRVAEFCRAALERALHAALAGEKVSDAFASADAAVGRLAPLPDPVAQAWIRWRGLLAERLGR